MVGAGVVGLTSALELARDGARVRIVASERPERVVSSVAAALWLPYEVEPEERVTPWALRSLEVFRELAQDATTGVALCAGVDLDVDAFGASPPWMRALGVRDLRAEEIPAPFTVGRAFTVPIIETPVYLAWLERELAGFGVAIEPRTLAALADVEAEADLIVNCCGLGARELCSDDAVFPIQGQVVRVPSFGRDTWELFRLSDAEFGYIVPRSNDVVLGGTNVRGAEGRTPDANVTRDILRRCAARDERIPQEEPRDVAVGLRPGRTGVRLELEHLASGTPVVHCYGHGGAGVTLSIGCAEEVRTLARGT